jgi:hypothetical protein
MPRIRTIKPEFFQHETLAELPYEARLLFIGLWTLADRRGRLEDRPKRIKAQLFPYDNIEVDAHLEALQFAGVLVRYDVPSQDGVSKLIQIKNFELHQRLSGKEAESESIWPGPDEGEAMGKQRGSDGEAPEKHPGAQEWSIGKGKEGKGKGGRVRGALHAPTPSDPAVISLPIIGGDEYPVLASQVAEFAKLYPAVDVEQALRDMRGWCIANPTRIKTRSGVLKFVNRWLSKDQNDPRKHRGTHAGPANPAAQPAPAAAGSRSVPIDDLRDRDRAFRERHGIDPPGTSPAVQGAAQQPRDGTRDHPHDGGGGLVHRAAAP